MLETEFQSQPAHDEGLLIESREARAVATTGVCPFHDGAATIDLLLAELGVDDGDVIDAALDLRALVTGRGDPAACLQQLCLLRERLDGRCYLALYRVRCWVSRRIEAFVRAHRGAVWEKRPLPRDFARMDELANMLRAQIVDTEELLPCARVRFAFAG